MSPEALTEYLHRHIPLTAAMQLRVLRSGDGAIELAAPLSPNRNHRDTAFGGSLATLGIVSGWALLQQSLRQEGLEARIVVQKSECEFLEPVAEEFFSASSLPAAEWTRFLDTLRKRKRARITIHSTLRCAGREVVRHSGTFVALGGEPT
jgi:thioesterase domain-containing protein